MLVSANNIFPKCTGLRWYNSVIIWIRELSGPVSLNEKKKGTTTFKMQNTNISLIWNHGGKPVKKGAFPVLESQYLVHPSKRMVRGMTHRKPRSNLMRLDFYSHSKAGHLSADFFNIEVRMLLPCACCSSGFWWVQAGQRGWCWTCAGDLNLWSICLSWEWVKLKTVLLG